MRENHGLFRLKGSKVIVFNDTHPMYQKKDERDQGLKEIINIANETRKIVQIGGHLDKSSSISQPRMCAFDDSFTTPLAGSYAILLDSFDNSIQELAQLLSLTLAAGSDGEARTNFVAKLVTEARKAMPQQPTESQEGEAAPVTLEEDPQAKVACLQQLAAAVDAQDLSLLSQKGLPCFLCTTCAVPLKSGCPDLTSFASLYISLLVPLRPAEINLEQQIQRLIAPLSDPAALTTVYNLIPNEPSFASLRLALLTKLVSATRHSKSQSIAVDHLIESGLLTADSAEALANTLLQDDPELALAFISRLPSSATSESLQRCAFRLTLAKPASFRFTSAASALPEWSLVTALFEQGSFDDKLLQVQGLPDLSKSGLQVKQRSLALAGALARGGEKVPYSEVRKILGDAADEEALEGAVIDGE